jgi:pimeloyl-ACP methyl ester carboxylesterase
MSREHPQVIWHEALYDIPRNENELSRYMVQFCMNVAAKDLSEVVPVVVLPGLAETRQSIEATIAQHPNERFIGVDLRYIDTSETGIEATVQTAPLAVQWAANRLLKREGIMDIAGCSIGGGAALKAVASAPENWRGAALITPFGLNNAALGATDKERRRQIIGRLQKNQLALGTEAHSAALAEETAAAISRTDMFNMLNYGVRQNGLELLQHVVAHGNEVVIISADNDLVFPHEELHDVLRPHNLHRLLRRVKGMHASLGRSEGREQLLQGIRELRKRPLSPLPATA